MRLEGIHHITAITGDAPGNVDFYARVLGLRLVKKTVNQDQPSVYHLFYADEQGSPGADITFFHFPRPLPSPRSPPCSTPTSRAAPAPTSPSSSSPAPCAAVPGPGWSTRSSGASRPR